MASGFRFVKIDAAPTGVDWDLVEQAGLSTLNEGQKVTYDVVTTDRGRTAAGNLKAG